MDLTRQVVVTSPGFHPHAHEIHYDHLVLALGVTDFRGLPGLPEHALPFKHFEPGEDVFHEGDLGDRLYIILSGEADVLRRHDGGEGFLDALRLSGGQSLPDIVPFVYLLFLVWLVIMGPGVMSLDGLLAKLFRPTPSESADAVSAEVQAARA